MKYCIWSNKGGVGKTFLTYALATEYARKNPEKYIVVIDMCPQANISEILLGGNGKGFKNFETILNQPNRQTIGGYFDKRISRQEEATKNESDFVIQVNHYAENLPKNLYLVAGDPSL